MGEMNLSKLAFYSARPTLRIDGQDNDMASGLLQSMVMREREGGMSSLELAFVNHTARESGQVGPAFEDEQVIKLGAEMKVYAGEAAAPTEIFSGLVSAIELAMDSEGPPRLIVQAEDKAQKGRMNRRIAVHDNGIGIPPHEQAQIFAKFTRGDEARHRGIKGTGIGLALVDEIVKAHRGHIEVNSAVGAGSTFTIVLPVAGEVE